jgi:predicted RNA binding protein YcfA (HicA-like mRNA interferase family)
MQKLTPVTRTELISRLKVLGFDGPQSGGKHQYMVKGLIRLTLPNPHKHDIGLDLLSRMLKQAGVDRKRWLQQ